MHRSVVSLTVWIALAALLDSAAGPSAQAASADAVAPAGTWYTRAGCAARTGVAATPPPGFAPRESWVHTVDGEIAGEPLVWNDRVAVEVLRGGERRIEWLDLATGKRLAATAWIEGAPLSPNLWGGQLSMRAGERKLALYAPRERSLDPIWTYEGPEEVYAPLHFEGSIYARVGDGIERLDPPATSPAWRTEGDYRSELVIRGGKLWALSYDKKGLSWLYEIDRATGSARKLVSCGQHQGQKPERGFGPQLCALEPQLFIHHSLPIVLADFGTTTVGMVDLSREQPVFGTAYMVGQAVDWGPGWLVEVPYADRGNCWIQELARTSEPPVLLAGFDMHNEFVGGKVSASIAGRSALIGARAFDVDTRRVLWSHEREVVQRAIPVRSGLLLAELGGKLSGWFAKQSGKSVSRSSGAAQASTSLPALDGTYTALLRDGSAVTGKFKSPAQAEEIDGVSAGGVKTKLAREDLLLLETQPGAFVWCAEPSRYAEYARTLAQAGGAHAWVELAREALGSKDPELVGRYVAQARALGSTDPDLGKTEKARLDLIVKAPRVNKARAEELAKRAEKLELAPVESLLERAKLLPSQAPRGARLALLSAALELAPAHAGARAALEESLPSATRGELGWSAADWVALAAAARSSELRALGAAAKDAPDAAAREDAAHVARAREAWKRDLVALGDQRLRLVAAEPRIESVRMVLSWADLVCGALEELWGAPAAPAAPPLSIWLHPDLESYRALVPQQTPDLKRQPETALAWHDWERETVHIVLPQDSKLLVSTRAAFAHALAHLWMRTRMPGVKPGVPIDDELPGWWIPVGMATFVEELGFDEGARTFGVQTGLTPSFDMVGQLGSEGLLDWSDLYTWDRARTARVDSRGSQVVGQRLVLGPKVLVSQLQLYYLQAAATVHYLWSAEDGRYRQALLDLVGAWHANEHKSVEIGKAFGLDAADLGKRVHEWTREVSAAPLR